MAESFSCKENGCDSKVIYTPQRVPGTMKFKVVSNHPSSGGKKTIYLICVNGHQHKYSVAYN